MMQQIKTVFLNENKLDLPLLGIFILVNLIVSINSLVHHPKIGYDADSHITYIQVLFDRLPDRRDSHEYFSPPLPYILPSIFDKICEIARNEEPHVPLQDNGYAIFSCRRTDGKFAQFLNLLLSIGTLYVVLLICQHIRPGNRFYKISTLALMSVLTVYYKTFSQVRPEPYVVFFVMLSAYWFLKLLETPSEKRNVLAFGVSLGLLVLSRQWGFFIFPAIVFLGIWLLTKDYPKAIRLIKPITASFILAALIGGWFYIHLYLQSGTLTAFNIEKEQTLSLGEFMSLARKTRIKHFDLFRNPIRPHFDGEPTPIFYSDTWGDYWGFFTYIKDKSTYGELGLGNAEEMGKYLGTVNLFSVIPTLVLGAGWLLAAVRLFNLKKPFSMEFAGTTLFFFIATASILGFAVFILNYYTRDDSTLKASYMLQFFMALTFLGADFLELVRKKSQLLYSLTVVVLWVVLLHNLPAFITRYALFPWGYGF